MSFWMLFFLSLALALDSFAISVTNGMTFDKINFKRAVIIAINFSFFQTFMSFTGYFTGYFFIKRFFYEIIDDFSTWIVIVLFFIIGIKMLIHGFFEHLNKRAAKTIDSVAPGTLKENLNEKMTVRVLILQGIATSIETFAVGASLSAINANIFYFAPYAGFLTAVLCFPAVFIGKKTGDLFIDKAQFLSGLIIILIALYLFFTK